MRRIILGLVVLAILVAAALPATAQNRGHDGWDNDWYGNNGDDNGWYDNNGDDNDWYNNVWCGWFPSWEGWSYWCYSPFWGWWELS